MAKKAKNGLAAKRAAGVQKGRAAAKKHVNEKLLRGVEGERACDAIRRALGTTATNVEIAEALKARFPKVDNKYVAWWRWKVAVQSKAA